jgi:hypothetical protein
MTIEGERMNGRDAAGALLEAKPEFASRLRLQVLAHTGIEAPLSQQAAGDAQSLARSAGETPSPKANRCGVAGGHRLNAGEMQTSFDQADSGERGWHR